MGNFVHHFLAVLPYSKTILSGRKAKEAKEAKREKKILFVRAIIVTIPCKMLRKKKQTVKEDKNKSDHFCV